MTVAIASEQAIVSERATVSDRGEVSRWLARLARPSLFLEGRALLELAQLFADPVYYGLGIPRGHGGSVLLLPGFLGSDSYLSILHSWLERVGYHPYTSGIWLMIGRTADLVERILERTEAVADANGGRITIIGHSLGGIMGRYIAQMRPDLVDHVITLGSPIGRNPRQAAHPLVAALADLLVPDGPTAATRARARIIEGAIISQMTGPLPPEVRLTAIYSREDAVVHWRACIDCDPVHAAYEVSGTHSGLAWNAQAYRHVGRALLE